MRSLLPRILVFLLLCPSAAFAYYCDGHWVDRSSLSDSFMNYSLNGARTEYNYSDPAASLQQFVEEACPAQTSRFSCYWLSDDPKRSRKQEEIHFVPHNDSSCKPFEPHSFLEKVSNRRVVLIGDSVMSQVWYSLVCSLYKVEENRMHLINKHYYMKTVCVHRPRCPMAPIPDESKPDPQRTENHGGFINFRRNNVSISYDRHHFMGDGVFAFLRRQNLSSHDIVITTFGLHYQSPDQHRRDLQSIASWIKSSTNPPKILVLHVPPQHFHQPNGYFRQRDDKPQCSPLQGWNDSVYHKKLSPGDWRNAVLEEVFMPLVKQKKAFIVPISMGLNGRHNSHLGWGDCTHWCFPSTIFKYVHMMISNALDRILPRRTHEIALPSNADWWKFHPALRDGMLIQFEGENSTYLFEKGVLREFESWNTSASRGFDVSTVLGFAREELGPVEFGEKIP